MSALWGITGPVFLALYGVGMVAVSGFAVLLRQWARALARQAEQRPLEVDELAFLAGGPVRAAETSLARLVDRGTVRVSRDGRVQTVGVTDSVGVDTAVLAAIGARSRSARLVVQSAATDPTVTSIGDALAARGLLVAPAVAQRVRLLTAAGVGALVLVGVARLVHGVAQDRPVGYPFLLLLGVVLIAVRARRWPEPRRTVRGDAALAAARSRSKRSEDVLSSPHSGELALLGATGGAATFVALGGLAAFPDMDVRDALDPTHLKAQAGSSAGTSGVGGSSCSSGSSCGSGSGGCGGCGGGSG